MTLLSLLCVLYNLRKHFKQKIVVNTVFKFQNFPLKQWQLIYIYCKRLSWKTIVLHRIPICESSQFPNGKKTFTFIKKEIEIESFFDSNLPWIIHVETVFLPKQFPFISVNYHQKQPPRHLYQHTYIHRLLLPHIPAAALVDFRFIFSFSISYRRTSYI